MNQRIHLGLTKKALICENREEADGKKVIDAVQAMHNPFIPSEDMVSAKQKGEH